jgi:adenylate cyclase
VGIDEESLSSYGQWPWPRYRLARLVEQLHDLGAAVVVLDFLMSEPDRTSPEVIISERRRDREPAGTLSQPASHDSNSQRLADTLSQGANVLGYFFEFSGTGTPAKPATPGVPAGMLVNMAAGSDAAWPRPTGMIRSIPLLTASAGAEGFTNALHDRDGTLRSVPLLLSHGGTQYPSLALAAILLATSERTLHLAHDRGQTTLEWGSRHIPLSREGNLLLDFRGSQQPFPYFSARAIMGGTRPPGSLKGKIVLVGANAKGLGDLHQVPSGQSVSGLNIHATVIDNILAGTFIFRPGWAGGAELIAILLLGTASTLLLSRSGFVLSLVSVAVGTIGCYAGARALLVAKGMYLSPLVPMLTPVAVTTILSLLKYGIEARKVRLRTNDLIEAQDNIINSMSALAEARDKETGGHILRTQRYVDILARQLATLPKYADLDETSIELLAKSAPLHDIGKVGIPDDILHKPGKLTEDEYALMKTHTLIGAQALSRTICSSSSPERNDFLQYAQQMIESHHECWDGSGYPHGLSGEDIPLAGRLMALADAYDALVSQRVYKESLPHDQVVELIMEQSGTKFDPDVVDAFIARKGEFYRVAHEFADDMEGAG